MDNASKALIMAGAILIAVALVGVGVYLYSSAAGMMNSGVDELASADMLTKNSKIELYDGVISGSELQTLMRQLNSYNANDLFPTDLIINGDMVTATGDQMKTNTNFKKAANYKIELEYDSNGWINKITATKQNT